MSRGMPRLILLPAAGYLGKNQGDRARLLAPLPVQLAESRPHSPSSLCSGPALGSAPLPRSGLGTTVPPSRGHSALGTAGAALEGPERRIVCAGAAAAGAEPCEP